MSVKVSAWVWEHSEATGSDRLALLAFADYAHDDGGAAFPSVPVLARKARISRSTALRCIKSLLADGRLELSGTTPRGTKIYRVLMTEGCQSDTPGGRQSDTGGVSSSDGGGVTGDTRLSIGEPLKEPLKEPPDQRPSLDIDSVIAEVFEAWRSGVGKGNGSQLTPHRRKKIQQRLEECMKLQPSKGTALAGARIELLEAVAGMVGSAWHRRENQLDFTLIFRDGERVQFFRDRGDKEGNKPPDSIYATTKKNPELED